MEIYVYKRPSKLRIIKNNILLAYYRSKLRYSEIKKGLTLLLKRETLCYYSYTSKKVLMVNGLQFIKYISADFEETAFLKINGTTHYCERF